MTEQHRRIGEDDLDALRITKILDGIPTAWERAEESIEQARRGETVPLRTPIFPLVVFRNS